MICCPDLINIPIIPIKLHERIHTGYWVMARSRMFGKNNTSITWNLRKGEQSFLYALRPRHPDLIYIPIKLPEDIPNGYWVSANTRMLRKLSKGKTWKVRKGKQLFLYTIHRPNLIHIPKKLHGYISNGYWFVCFVWFGLNVAFNNLPVISRQRLDVTGSSMLTFRVLPHWNIMPQTLWHDIPPSHIILTLSCPVPIPSSTFLMLSAKRKSS